MSRGHVEDSYPLSPMQEGMLFHTLYAPRAGVDIEQMACVFREPLDGALFRDAWARVIAARPVLRTAFRWQGIEAPLQDVHRDVDVPWWEEDLRTLSSAEQGARVDAFLARDRAEGFDLSCAPLMRFALFRTGEAVHRFVWTFHHILLDGRSFPLIIEDVFAGYDALSAGRAVELPERRPYSDFIAWLRARDADASEVFWRSLLRGFTAPTPLLDAGHDGSTNGPALRREVRSVEEIEYGERTLRLSVLETAALVDFGARHRVSLNAILQGAWALLLSRYSGDASVVFGATRACRRTALGGAGTDTMVGVFINTLPMRVPVPLDVDLVPWLQDIQAHGRAQRDHEHTPLVKVRAWSELPPSAPIFETLFVFEERLLSTALRRRGGAWQARDFEIHRQTSFPLALIVYGEGELLLEVEYDRRRFDDAIAGRMLDHLANALRAFLRDPGQRLANVSLIGDDERRRVLVEWNETAHACPDAFLHEIFAEQAARTPDAVALRFERHAVSYRELSERANRLAHALRRHGVGPDVLVGVCMERSIELLVALVGVLAAGGAYLPLDPRYPKDRLAFMLDDAKPKVIVTHACVAGALSDHEATAIVLDADSAAIAREPTTAPARGGLTLDALAYVIYTSGSTGRPKGAMNAHRGIANRLLWMQRAHALSEADRVLQKTPYSFDVSVWELFWPLLFGAELVIARPEGHRDPAYIAGLIAEEGVTVVHFVPSMLAAFLDDPAVARCPSIRRVFCSGEALPAALADRALGRLTAELHNLYGPTEAAVEVTAWACTAGATRVPIGRPIDNVRVYLLDERLSPVPVGVSGELHIAGVQVGRGYLDRPELTAERFVPDPFGADSGARMYKTGDRARWLRSGAIEYLGRADFQVKIRGLRIELGEIEAALGRHPAVREAVVVAREDEPGEKRLVAYLAGTSVAPDAGELRSFLQKDLPEHMVPAVFVGLDALPLTVSGKVDRRALPAPEATVAGKAYVAPRGPIEEALAAIFAEVLKTTASATGAHDDFFELGGHSLLAAQAITRIRAAFGIDLPVRALFDAPTVAGLAACVEATLCAGRADAVPPLEPSAGPLVLSFAQERLWVLDQLTPGDPTYVVLRATRLRGPLDRSALEGALTEIVRRHEVFRTTIESVGGRPVLTLQPAVPVPVPVTSLAAVPEVERDAALERELTVEAQRTFDLAAGPLLRARLVELAPEDRAFVVTMHHIVCDAWTLGVLSDELGSAYQGLAGSRASSLPELSVQYADYARWQRRRLSGEVLDRELTYWRAQLDGAPQALDLPADRPRLPIESHRGARASVAFPAELSRAVKELSRREGVTLFMTLLAAFDVLLHRYTGQTDLLVGTPIANRTQAATEKLCGLFLNTLVLRADLASEPSFRALLHAVRETALAAYVHQELPFERLVQELAPERDLSRAPLFQVMFTLQNGSSSTFTLPGLDAAPLRASMGTSKFDLTLNLADGSEGLGGFFEYATDLFDAATIDRMAGHLQVLLERAVAAPDTAIRDLPLLRPVERRQVLVEWNDTAYAHLMEGCIHDIFAAQAARTPDATALRFEGHEVSYCELDERGNRLARALQRRGVGPDVLVGVCMERSIEMVVALHGVLKAGGAYVPLDPEHPRERLAFMIEDAQPSMILTQAHLAAVLPEHGAALIRLDVDWEVIAREPADAPARGELSGDHLAYVIYTSGSTGRPKGAMNAHRGVANRLLWMQRVYVLTEVDRVLQKTPYSFDVSVWELFWPLLFGASLVIARPEGHRDPAYLAELVSVEAVTTLHFVPSMLAAFLDDPAATGCRSIRRIFSSGEALPPALADRLLAKLPVELHNLYGPTETAVDVTAWACSPGAAVVPIGRPIDNVRTYILDERLAPVPIGVRGELYIGGVQVGRGYLNRPELTAERFVCDLFDEGSGARLYRTGDLARWLPSGVIEYLGRADFQVKIRGFRIELGEIEAALGRHPAVREAVVLAREDVPGEKRLVAYLVCGEVAPSAGELRSFLESDLPEYLVPAIFVVLDALPLTASSKVNRRALPAPEEGELAERSAEYAAPATPAEEALTRIWSAVLRLPRVGVHDNFFEAGGDSILSIQVVAQARQVRLQLTPRQVFQHPTIAELARVAGSAAEVAAEQGPVTGPVPLTPIACWWLAGDPRGRDHWNQAFLLEVDEALDATALGEALAALVTHHDALRVRLSGLGQTFAEPGGAPPLACVDLSRLPEAAQESALAESVEEAQASLDLARGPALRAVLFDLGHARSGRLLVVVHHLAVDGVSWRILFEDLWSAYAQRREGRPIALRAKTTSLRRWAELLLEHARSAAVLGEEAYWTADAWRRAGSLPVDLDAGEPSEASTKRHVVSLSVEETEALLREVPEAYGTQINDVLLAALAETLAEWTGSPDVLVDLEGHGREDIFPGADVTRTIGWFTALFPVALHAPVAAGPGERLKAIKEQLRAIPGRGVGHGLLRYLGPDPIAAKLGAMPRAEILFNYLGQVDQVLPEAAPLRLAAEPSGPAVSPAALRRHLLDVVARVLGGQLIVRWAYSENRHRAATIVALGDRFLASLRRLVAHASAEDAGGYTPSDFRRVQLSQASIDQLAVLAAADAAGPRRKNIDDVFPLSPMAEGLLFHTMLATRREAYLVQLRWTLRGALDPTAFARAWQAVVARHALLRSAVSWELDPPLDAPVQVVRRSVRVPVEAIDLRDLAPEQQEARIERFAEDDRRRGFDVTRAPLFRVGVFRVADATWRLLWTVHHLILDGWSLPLVLNEVAAFHEAFASGRALRLPAARPYGDYLDWLAAQDRTRAAAFWRAELHDFATPTPLGFGREGVAAAALEPGEAQRALSDGESAELSAFARRHRITASTLVQAAWALLLARYAGGDDVLFGVIVSGRAAPLPGIDGMVGLFINTLPLRVAVPLEARALGWLSVLQNRQADLRDFEHTPLVEAQAQSSVPRGTPLFESLLVFENFPVEESLARGDRGLAFSEMRAFEWLAYPLTLVASFRRALTLRVGYDRRRFDDATIERVVGHLISLLVAFVRSPRAALGALPMLEAAERRRVLFEWNDTEVAYPRDASIEALFAEQAARMPDAVAVTTGAEHLSYGELRVRANHLAHALRARGVGFETPVGLHARRSIEMVVATLAILEAGGAYVPLDPDLPPARLTWLLEDAEISVVLTTTRARIVAPFSSVTILQVDAELQRERGARLRAERLPSVAAGDRVAYIMYTSGSTGAPKGVCVPHRAVVRLVKSTTSAPFGAGEVFAQLAPIAFDAATLELWGPLLNGGRLVVFPDEAVSPARIGEVVQREGVTTLWLTAGLFNAVIEARPAGLSTLCRLLCGGEALSVPHVQAALAQLPTVAIINGYGPTEGTTFTCCHLIETAGGASAIPIGRPIANTTAYVLDERLVPVPIGVPGELYAGGDGVARGYLRRPDLTAERFLPDPFAREPGRRLYRTGDRVRWLADGTLAFLGRLDQQVKLRGFRIELGEIEAVLIAHPEVSACAVVVREGAGSAPSPTDRRLVAYVVGRRATPPDPAELGAYLRERLPAYMVPSAYVQLEALPLTANGKLDRRALPAYDAGRSTQDYVAPRGPIEEVIAAVFTDVLGIDRAGAHDDFFDLGGHSLTATVAITRLRRALGVELPLSMLFDAPTVAGLAGAVVEALLGEPRAFAPPLLRALHGAPLVPSFGQERMWFLYQLAPDDPTYVVSRGLRMKGDLDVGALTRALTEIAQRHQVLRTTFAPVDGRPVPIVQDAPLTVGFERKASSTVLERDAAVALEAAVEARRPVDLATGPVFRARLIELAPDDHLLLVSMHHAVTDAWSDGILNRELTSLYRAFHEGQPSPLLELPIQYPDFARWQRGWLSGDALEAQLAYWRRALAGAPAAIDLPTDRPRPPLQSHRGGQLRFSLGRELTRALQALARREGATLFMTLLAAYDVLLHRYTGQGEIVVGSPIAGRTRAETEPLLGFFLNTLVLRTRVSGADSFRALLRRVRTECLGAYAHQDAPFERLVQELRPDTDPSRSPLFQVIFNLQNAPVEAVALPGVEVSRVVAGSMTVKVDLTLIMNESQGALGGVFEYATDLFDATTIERLLGHFEALLGGIVKDPAGAIGELPLLVEDERRRLLDTWNDTATAYPDGELIHGMFEARAAEMPDGIALIAGEAHLSFGELDARANRLAHRLQALGVGPDDGVGLCIDRSAEVVVGLLGILKAGGAYVPLDPVYPRVRLTQILADAGARVVVTRASLAGRVLVEGVAGVCVDDATLAAASDARVASVARPEGLAYVLYTSGSTGAPKGVAVEHRHLVNYVRGVSSRLALPLRASYAHVSTFAADLGNTVLFPPLCMGGTLHLIAEALTTDPDALALYIDQHRIDCLKIVPSHLSALLSGARPERVLPRDLLVLGGEASSWELVDRLARLAGGLRVMNHYGPTETTVGVLTHAVDAAHRASTRSVPLGRPLPNARIYVLDARLAPVPVGVPGEVFIGGAGVARGYLGQPDLTAERFVPDPFAPSSGSAKALSPSAVPRLYRTGDRARYLPDGTLVFLGRVDHQVKLRGFRIELGEIEAALIAHESVREAVVLVREEAPGERQLVAYVVPSVPPAPASSSLRSFLKERLPEVMVPPSIVALDAWPLTPNGKIDRRALAALAVTGSEGEHVAPRTPIEEVLAGIWADVFERERIGVGDRFADLGGHSLLAIQIIARAREAFQVEVPLRAIFEAPTVAALAGIVEAALREGEGLEEPPVVKIARGDRLPLSFSQERLWFLAQLEPESVAYNVSMGLRLTGELDVRSLERALREIERRHEVLRTTFASFAGEPVQIIHEGTHLGIVVEDLQGLPEGEREGVARREAEVEARRPFDLGTGPLLRARLLRLAPDDHVLLIVLHHIVTDAWTRGILNRELAALYESFHAGRPPRLPELPVQYADFAAWQRRWLQGAVAKRLGDYWKKQLAGAPAAIELPLDRPRPPVQSAHGGRRSLDLPLALARPLAELSRRENVTLFMSLLSAFAVQLYRSTHQGDLVIGTPVANRTRPETEGLLGLFVNTLVLRVQLGDDLTFRDLLVRVREVCFAGYAHQEMPFERLVQELAPERDLSRAPLFQVMFAYQSEPSEALRLPGLELRPFRADTGTSKFDLLLAVTQGPEALHALFEYASDLFDGATIERMLGHFRVLLEGIAADPDRRLRDLPLLPEPERQLLAAWGGARAGYSSHFCVHERFERQVDQTPDACAVTFEGRSLTYGELDARANQLARHLRARGVGPDALVGLCTERSLDMLVGLLGILKAGGAYLPLDPEYPAERLVFMLEDAEVRIVLTQEHLAVVTPERRAERVLLDADWATIAGEPPDRPASDATPENLAYVIYTSGSTGKPKGAMVEHRNVVRLFEATFAWYRFDARDVWTMFHSHAFDFSVWEIWGALFHGGRVVIVPYWVSRSPTSFYDLLAEEGVTVLSQTPSAFRQLVRADEAAASELRAALSLRHVVFGGEALDLGDLRPWWERHGDAVPRLVNMYGITETTVHVTYRPLGLADLERTWSSVIGRPIPDLSVYVLDSARQRVPIGVPGEMYVGGAGVARGYLRRDELTAARFLRDPHQDEPGARVYRTGDLARYLPSGELEYLGRIDHQVKIRGFRVELGEIEAVLGAHPSVREAVVLAREDVAGDKRLVAYLVCREGLAPTRAELRAFVKQSLPDMMVPAAFVRLDALPLTANGKVDRRALPAPDEREHPVRDGAYAAPGTRVEGALCEIWAKVLRLDRVGIHDNFFELGGDSILSIQIVARAREAGLCITPRLVFQNQTVAELALAADTTGAPVAEQGAVAGPVPLTPIQAWWLLQDAADPHHHNQSIFLEAREALDPAVLELALAALVDHHDMLRLRVTRDGGFRQIIAPPGAAASLARIDVSTLAGAARTAAIEEAAGEVQASLDLAAGPIVRAALFEAAPQRLLLVVHHLAIDGVSWRILLEDLWTAYAQARRGEEVRLAPKTTSFKRWAESLAAYARSEAARAQESFWLAESRRDVGRLPLAHAGESLEGSTRVVSVELDRGETEQLLREVPEVYRTQMNDVLLAALAEALSPLVGSRRVLVDLEGHGREEIFGDVDVTRTVGWFTTIFPVVLDLSDAPGPGAVMTQVKEQLRRVPERGIGYGVLRYLREGEAVAAKLAAARASEVSFNYLGQFDRALPEGSPFAFARESVGASYSPRAKRAYPLDVQASIRGGCLRVRFAYGEGRLGSDVVEELAQRFRARLRGLVAHCLSAEAGGYTPSDFTKADLTQEDIGDLLEELGEA
jgi:amino acid adenylation domain-containing protein/non-ribosomal peptide synthase protein (TIGR01720 family)